MELGVLEIHWGNVCEDRVEVGGNCVQNVMFERKENRRLQNRSEKVQAGEYPQSKDFPS